MARFISIPDHVIPPVPDEKWGFGGLEFTNSFNWPVSGPADGRMRYNPAAGQFEFSMNGSAWASIPAIHAALRQLIHFIDEGPAEGFASGSYKETTGTLYPTSIVWYDKAGPGKIKIVEKLITWTGILPTTVVWKMYSALGALLITLTDTITYSGVYEVSRLRTWS